MKLATTLLFWVLLSSLSTNYAFTQDSKATIVEEKKNIPTYPYSDPDPIPIIGDKNKIYPYFKFQSYSHNSELKEWKVVKLENDYIEVYVLPEVGGKVYGAIEKSTGEEFIYTNKVMKFRNIGMRGPWTSGGIEFNFGIIGHSPSTASPVDYQLVENQDGSVSCFVGNMDLPSRTHWRVEIKLPKDKAYFETKVHWFNPTPLHQSYYNWMTGAAAVSEDLEFFFPGNTYLTHSGDPLPWPYHKSGKHISEYKENNFGSSKSYHVVGEYNNYFGGYFHQKDFGFGHWVLYEEMPGQKLWLWALSRSGGIWEDLLTDKDGQYIEFQAGRQLNQYSPNQNDNPITQVPFYPNATDSWREIWFPIKGTGGISAVSPQAVMHVTRSEDSIIVKVNALAKFKSNLVISLAEKEISSTQLEMKPMAVSTISIPNQKGYLKIIAPDADLIYDETPHSKSINRDFTPHYKGEQGTKTPYKYYYKGLEAMESRQYDIAIEHFSSCINMDPYHMDGMAKLAEIYYRNGQYDQALQHINQGLSLDTYHPAINYIGGLIYKAKKDYVNALETLGWAARSTAFRNAAYTQMASVSLATKDLRRARFYSDKALENDIKNLKAYWIKAIIYRLEGNQKAGLEELDKILAIDPLNHLAKVEIYLTAPSEASYEAIVNTVQNEFPQETFLEGAIEYAEIGQYDEAINILINGPSNVKNKLWTSYLLFLDGDKTASTSIIQAVKNDPDFVFPYRRETLAVTEWAFNQQSHWKTAYYLGLNYWAKNRKDEAKLYFNALGNDPDYAPFYIARANLTGERYEDVKYALSLDPTNWRYHHLMIQEEWRKSDHKAALELVQNAGNQFPENYTLGFDLAKAELQAGNFMASIEQLNQTHILPFEGASEARSVYEDAHIFAALDQFSKKKLKKGHSFLKKSLEWPENLGVGKPYSPDEKIQNYLLGYYWAKRGKDQMANTYFQKVVDQGLEKEKFTNILFLKSLKTLEKNADIEQIIDRKKKSSKPINRWIIANWEEDTESLNELLNNQETKEVFVGREFEITQKIMNLP